MKYIYNDIEFTGKITRDKDLEIYRNGEFLFVVDMDRFEDMTFEEIIEYFCDDNYANRYEEMYFQLRALYE